MSKTRIAVAGTGYIGLAHMDAAQAARGVTLSAVAAKAGVALYASIDELLAHDRPDGLVLAISNHLHVRKRCNA